MNKTTVFELTTTMVHLAIPPEAGENVSFPLIIWEQRGRMAWEWYDIPQD